MEETVKINGQFYTQFSEKNNYTEDIKKCIEETVFELLHKETDANRPGILLGKVQSGKTRTFIGVMALCFDNNYDIVVVLTKGTKALAKQTLKRLRNEFNYFETIDDSVRIFDIMSIPDNLTRYSLSKKLIFVVKKEDDNMRRLEDLFFNSYRELGRKNILIIDDEADFASIGFSSSKDMGLRMNVIANQINQFRKLLNNKCDLLQVTATPYSLYLQPDEIVIQNEVFQPLRPAFTKLVPIHDKYIGGKEYFESDDEDSLFFYLWEEVSDNELEILSRPHGSYLNNIMTSPSLLKFRQSIISFIVGGIIRRLQNKYYKEKENKYSFIIHTDVSKIKHTWQMDLAIRLKEVLEDCSTNNSPLFRELANVSYNNLILSLAKANKYIPDFDVVFSEIVNAINNEYLGINTVNSDSDIETLLNDSGQLNLDNPLNIFIGGQILDRGVTIENLIGFFYGRNPNRFQLDTVLQHSRMYGARSLEDMAVTRFYTTTRIYDAMRRMHDIDSALRSGFESNQFDKGVTFIHQDTQNQIRPCSPNKILISETVTLRPSGRQIPIGFTTKNSTEVKERVKRIENLLLGHVESIEFMDSFLVKSETVSFILDEIQQSLEFTEGYNFDWDSFKTSLLYLSQTSTDESLRGKIFVMLRHDRQARRYSSSGKFNGKPEASGPGREGDVAKQTAVHIPFLLLLKQNGSKELGWKDSPFWWPVAYLPQRMRPMIYSTTRN